MSKSQLKHSILLSVKYSSLFSYPLSAKEIKYWLPVYSDKIPLTTKTIAAYLSDLVKKKQLIKKGTLYCLPNQTHVFALRQKRQVISQTKWQIAKAVSKRLGILPWIKTIAVTGSLAMNNCEETADIDLMTICLPNTLWLTRLLIWLLLFPQRRSPNATTPANIKDKICDNVYLESNYLNLSPASTDANRGEPASLLDPKSFYLAHEILQAKPVFDSGGTYAVFLDQNRWTNKLFPFAKPYNLIYTTYDSIGDKAISFVIYLPNLLAFIFQYLFMSRKITGESISFHRALFHPKQHSFISPLSSLLKSKQ